MKPTKRPNGKWEVRWRETGKRHSRSFQLKRDAEAFALEIARRRQLGGVVALDAGAQPLAEFVEDWWRDYAVPDLSSRTRQVYAAVWGRHLLPRIGGYPLRKITPGVVDQLRVQLQAAGVGDPTIIKALGILQGILRHAVLRGQIQSNPVREVKKPRQAQKQAPTPLDPTSIEVIRALLPLADATLVSVMAYGGLRPEEATHVEVEHIGPRKLLVPARKSLRDRRVALLAPLAQDLRTWQVASGIRSGLLFRREHGGPWVDHDWRNWRRRVYQPAAKAAGVRGDLRPYRLRGSFVSLLLWEGRSLIYVADQAGHRVDTLAEHYAGVIEDLEDGDRVGAEEAIRAARASAGGRSVDARTGC